MNFQILEVDNMNKIFGLSLLVSLMSFNAIADDTPQYVERPIINPVLHHGGIAQMVKAEYSNIVPCNNVRCSQRPEYIAVMQGTDFSPKDSPFYKGMTYNSRIGKYEYNQYRTF